MRGKMDSLIKTKAAAYRREHGLDTKTPPLVSISPALDIIISRSSDPAHSEYGGIIKQLHLLLMSTVLTPEAQKSYSEELQTFRFLSGWGRLQSPVYHLGSYGLQEHARWSIIIPALLRCWLRNCHIQLLFLNAVPTVFTQSSKSSVDIRVTCIASITKSTTLLMSDQLSIHDRAEFSTVKTSRRLFQNLLEVPAKASSSNPWSQSATPVCVEASNSVLAIESEAQAERVTTRALEYCQDKGRPNVHIGLHYDASLAEYGIPAQYNILIGEDKH